MATTLGVGTITPSGWNYNYALDQYEGPNGEVVSGFTASQYGGVLHALQALQITQQYGSTVQPPTGLGPIGANGSAGGTLSNGLGQFVSVGQAIQSGLSIDQPKNFVVKTGKGDITLNLKTGDITFPVGLSRDEAIRDFWFGFQKHFPCGNDEHYERSINILKDELKKQKQKADEYGEYVVKETRKRIAGKIANKYHGEKFIMVKPEDLIRFIEEV